MQYYLGDILKDLSQKNKVTEYNITLYSKVVFYKKDKDIIEQKQ